MVFSGGVALGAYHAGAYTALQEESGPDLDWVAGASISAVTAIIAGNRPGHRSRHLRRFWDELALDPMPWVSSCPGAPAALPQPKAPRII
ncbi:patatin-like phospholipase family protein [Roseomonas xinghualingensis]|uniref:patatin-like phospholipase family protein n=1 Tax=Roseomonas xinghualingensis TaxID=2986475 RepID=UPI0021F0ADB8|nr:patatin-like phospholipase family protein [Roseomonas sp. SXEYE001]MCV4206946.1 patatin-like phospholipase family protein [Roseomonas sp. SXEYE001]